MVLAREIYDNEGYLVYQQGTMLGAEDVDKLHVSNFGEVIIEDDRLGDVLVSPMFSPELEGHLAQALKKLMLEGQDTKELDSYLVRQLAEHVRSIIQLLFPEPLGEINATGCSDLEDYDYLQPAKAACLAALIGKRLGLEPPELESLGMAAMLKDVGYLAFPAPEKEKGASGPPVKKSSKKHTAHGARLLKQSDGFAPEAVQGVLDHHERWNGSGYPGKLRGDAISQFGRILTVADNYYELVSVRPDRRALMPHEAVEFIMAFSAESFDPDIVQVFSRQIPLYPTGVMVKLSSGEVGLIADSNIGHIGRPIVRIVLDEDSNEVTRPFDVDLSDPRNQRQLITKVMEY
jgi:HD-GYP domain-containing protein (c-di-GMP phosphodiesterase class II)